MCRLFSIFCSICTKFEYNLDLCLFSFQNDIRLQASQRTGNLLRKARFIVWHFNLSDLLLFCLLSLTKVISSFSLYFSLRDGWRHTRSSRRSTRKPGLFLNWNWNYSSKFVKCCIFHQIFCLGDSDDKNSFKINLTRGPSFIDFLFS